MRRKRWRCQHENADEIRTNVLMFSCEVGIMTRLVCMDCGDLCSLGPANDDGSDIIIEIRAAEIAEREPGISLAEANGWGVAYLDHCSINVPIVEFDQGDRLAGWLGYQIANSDGLVPNHKRQHKRSGT